MKFLRQRVSSDYCGVYSSAMLCGFLGYEVSKRRAIAAFGGHSKIRKAGGVTLAEMAEFLRKTAHIARADWHCWPRANQAGVGRFLQRHGPTLLMFRARLEPEGVEALHIVVAVGTRGNIIRLLDPLCPPPAGRSRSNSTWEPRDVMIGRRYSIVSSHAVHALRFERKASSQPSLAH